MAESGLESVLGRGRSGIVFRSASDSSPFARKVFVGDRLSNAVHYFFSGAPNPYGWNQDAVKAAFYRRNVVADLCEFWFGSEMRVARALGVSWNEKFRDYELQAELVQGHHAWLHNPFSRKKEGNLEDLLGRMSALQARLLESGFDGLLWQAGKGNPVAAGNFMRDGKGWVWVDLESGVPALFPLNPCSLFSFYLPRSFSYGRALFDDVDVDKLSSYVRSNEQGLASVLGAGRFSELVLNVEFLGSYQDSWKSVGRAEAGIESAFRKGVLSEESAGFYSRHPSLWFAREAARNVWAGYNFILGELPWRAFNAVTMADYRSFLSDALKYV